MKWRNGDLVEFVLIVLRNVMTVGMDGAGGGGGGGGVRVRGVGEGGGWWWWWWQCDFPTLFLSSCNSELIHQENIP